MGIPLPLKQTRPRMGARWVELRGCRSQRRPRGTRTLPEEPRALPGAERAANGLATAGTDPGAPRPVDNRPPYLPPAGSARGAPVRRCAVPQDGGSDPAQPQPARGPGHRCRRRLLAVPGAEPWRERAGPLVTWRGWWRPLCEPLAEGGAGGRGRWRRRAGCWRPNCSVGGWPSLPAAAPASARLSPPTCWR